MILVSACLAGVKTRYDATDRVDAAIRQLVSSKKALPLCPEVMGGRSIPREPVEIKGGSGQQVIMGLAKTVDKAGSDHTREILDGVAEFMKAVRNLNVKAVILKSKSPTCGYGKIYDGTFSGKLVDGDGVLAAELEKEGIKIYNEENCGELIKELMNNLE
jgi:uncharacterized protein YbbK (DUF523 family)